MFSKKGIKSEKLSKDEIIQKLEEEKIKLQQELKSAKARIRRLESEARVKHLQQRETFQLQEPIVGLSRIGNVLIEEGGENRDDDGYEQKSNDDPENFSVEVTAIASGISEDEKELLHDNIEMHSLISVPSSVLLDDSIEMHSVTSVTSSACTIPTGNDKKSKFSRCQHQLRQRLRRGSNRRYRGEDAHLGYFSKLRPPLERITESDTQQSFLAKLDDRDESSSTVSATSDLTASVASLTSTDDDSISESSQVTGRSVNLYAMKSLLQTNSGESDVISFEPDDEHFLFGEI